MGCYRKSMFDAFRRRYSTKNAWNFKGLVPRSSFSTNSNLNALRPRPDYYRLRLSQPIFRNWWIQINQSVGEYCNGGAMGKRFYSVQQQSRKRVRYVRIIAVVLVIGTLTSELIIPYAFTETVPYSKRKQFMLVDWDTEKELGIRRLEEAKATYRNKILPPHHPQNIRLQRIAQNIVDAALHGGLNTHQLNDENLKHLEGLDWEFIVIDEPIRFSLCYLAGKIIFSTGLLKILESDAEIASVIGREVAHAVARHYAETMSCYMHFILRTMFLPLLMPKELRRNLFSRALLSRELENEADYIGMLLMASAGYDPRVSPLAHNKRSAKIKAKWPMLVCSVDINSKWAIWVSVSSTHPHLQRAQFLSHPKAMKEAMCLYREAQLRQGISSAISKASSSY